MKDPPTHTHPSMCASVTGGPEITYWITFSDPAQGGAMAKPCYRLAPNGGSLKITSELYFLSTHFNYSDDSIACFVDFVKRKSKFYTPVPISASIRSFLLISRLSIFSLSGSIAGGDTESSSMFIARNVSVRSVSAASSPHIPIHAPFL